MKKKKQDKDHPYSSDQHSLHSVSESLDTTIPVAAKPPSVTSTNDSSLPSTQQGVSVKKKKSNSSKTYFFQGLIRFLWLMQKVTLYQLQQVDYLTSLLTYPLVIHLMIWTLISKGKKKRK